MEAEERTASQGAERVMPYDASRPKGEQVEEMFDSIAPAYDFMNGAMTFGMHVKWRDKALKLVSESFATTPNEIIDLATGTGDVAFALSQRFSEARVTGCDLSTGMLRKAEQKRDSLDASQAERLTFEQGDCLNLKYDDNSFQLATIAYGIRNFENLEKGLAEIYRILTPGGRLMILELSYPRNLFLRAGYNLYTKLLIPLAGRLASGDNRAYAYLPESIKAMPPREEIKKMMEGVGFKNIETRTMTMGVVTIYTAEK